MEGPQYQFDLDLQGPILAKSYASSIRKSSYKKSLILILGSITPGTERFYRGLRMEDWIQLTMVVAPGD